MLAVRLIKWFLSFLLTVTVLIVLAIIIVPRVFDPNDHRDQITQLVQDKTGREMQLNGELEVSVFPWLGIRTQGLSLAQPDEIGGQMVQVDTAQLRVKLMPLLSKRVEIDTVVLEKPQIRFVTLANGSNSLAGLIGETSDAAEPSPENQSAELAVAIVVQGLQLSDGSLEWDDRQTGQRYQISDLQLATGNLIGDDLADLNISATILDLSDPNLTAQPINLALDAQARIDTESLLLSVNDLSSQIQQGDYQLTGGMQELIYDNAGSDLQLKAVELDIQAGIADQSLEAKLGFSGLSYGIDTAQIQLTNLAIDGNFDDLPFDLSTPSVEANLDAQTASMASTEFQSEGLSMAISNLQITQFIDNLNASGSLRVEPFDAAALLKKMDIDYVTIDQQALTQVALSSVFDAGLDHLSLSNLDLSIDSTRLQGELAARNFANPAVEFDLALDKINLDGYLTESAESGDNGESSPSGAYALAVPMALFKEINANGIFKAQELISAGVTLTDIDVQIESSPGMVTVTPRAKLYDGELSGSMVYTENDGESQLHVQNKLGIIDLAKFLTDADVTDQLSGFGQVELDVVVTERDGVQSNQGTIKLLANDGAVKGVDVKNIVDQAYSTYQQLSGSAPDDSAAETGTAEQSDETGFAEMLGTFVLNDFELTNNDFSVNAPFFRISGAGDIDLAAQNLDYRLDIAIVKSTAGQGGQSLEDLQGITLPLRLSGSLLAPNYLLDTNALYRALAKAKVDEKKGEYLQEEFGIEDGGELSTKDVFRELLIREVVDEEETAETTDSQPPAAPDTASENSTSPDSANASSQDVESEQPLTEKQQRDELKRKLLEGLFN